ncbi:MAG: ParB/RepB/Spo0J family partition protein [Clostridia bacterium]|nr:ParB/RepB/Spo0J family partition protein [Clostridia bacterium]MBQ4620615.1 ParB/RepB/Spo0J family partition protein [Clostridia bacterium]
MAAKKTAPRGLGRGLGALLGEIDEAHEALTAESAQPGDRVENVRIVDIDPNRDQPRKDFDEESLKELSESIQAVGVIQPVILTKKGSRYQIVAGERRWRASRMAGLNEIPAIVRDWDEITRMKAALIENLQRDDLNPVEEALGIQTLMKKCDLTQEAVSKVVGKSRSAVANMLRLLTLPEQVLEMLKNGAISAGHARALVSVSPAERQLKLALYAVQQGWSVRQLERISAQPEKEETPKKKEKRIPELQQLEKMARDVFGTRAKLNGDTNSGKLVLSYSSYDDLERIWEVLECLLQSEQ